MARSVALGDLLQEILDMSQLLKKKREAAGGEGAYKQLLSKLLSKLEQAAPLKVADATKIHKAVDKACFAENEQKLLLDSADAAVLAEASPGMEAATTRPQTLIALGNYLTEEDWQTLNSADSSYAAKPRVVASRLRKLGVQSLAEQTVR